MWSPSNNRKSTVLSLLVPLLLLALCSSVSARIRKDDNPTGRDIHIVNHSDVKVDIFWINPQTKELVKSVDTGILKGTDAIINSYIGHEFEVQELPRKTDGKCRGLNDECRTGRFVVSSNEDQRFTIEKDISVTYEDARSKAMQKAKKVSDQCPMPQTTDSGGKLPNLDEWAECLQRGINATLDVSREEIEFQAGVRKNMGRKLVDYACSDEEFPTSVSTYNQTLNLGLGSRNPMMKFLFQSETSKVILFENFVARSQCRWLKENAAKGGKNKLEWSSTNDVAIRTVVERIYKALKQAVEYSTEADYLDRQRQSGTTTPLFELYTATEGGESQAFAAEDHANHPLLGTFMLFCDAPEKGGAIHFPKTATHVKPAPGNALLITYLEPTTGEATDDVFTAEHVECPVVEGKQTTLKYHIPAVRE